MIQIPRLLSAQNAHQQGDGGNLHEELGEFAKRITVTAKLSVRQEKPLSYRLIWLMQS